MSARNLAALLAAHPRPAAVLVLVLGAAVAALFSPRVRVVVLPMWRLVTGGLVLRVPGPWDSTWTAPAPPRPANRPTLRGESVPLTAWGRMPGAHRMMWRWSAAALVVLLWVATLPTLLVGGVVFTFLCVRRIWREIVNTLHGQATRTFVDAVAGPLGLDDVDPARWLAIPSPRVTWTPVAVPASWTLAARRVHRLPALERILGNLAVPSLHVALEADDARIRVQYPATLSSERVIQEVGKIGEARFPDGPWKATHKAGGLEIVWKHPKRPPSFVEYDAAALDAYPVDEIPIGKRAGGEWVTLPLKKLTPHGIVSATTGWCKTTTLNVYIAHVTGRGGRAFINDPKRVGYSSAFGNLPNVEIRTTVEGWAEAVARFLSEMERRYSLIERFPQIKEDPEAYFQPWFLINDERGSYVADLRDWWKSEGEKGIPGPLRAEKKILWQARAAGMYVADAAQQASLDVFVDSDGRDQRMWRIASGPQTRSSWIMLFPGIPKSRAGMKKGRAMLGIGVDSVEEIQLASITDGTARAFALAGVEVAEKLDAEREKRLAKLIAEAESGGHSDPDSPSRPGQTPGNVWAVSEDGQVSESAGESRLVVIPGQRGKDGNESLDKGGLSLVKSDQDSAEDDNQGALIVGLAAAAEHLGMTQQAFEKARQRRPIPGERRSGVSPAWTPLVLAEWRRQAPRAGAS